MNSLLSFLNIIVDTSNGKGIVAFNLHLGTLFSPCQALELKVETSKVAIAEAETLPAQLGEQGTLDDVKKESEEPTSPVAT